MADWNNPYPRGTAGYDAYNRAWQAAQDFTPPSTIPSSYNRVQGYDNPYPAGSSAWDAYNTEHYPRNYDPRNSIPDSYSPSSRTPNPESIPTPNRGRPSSLPRGGGGGLGWGLAGALAEGLVEQVVDFGRGINNLAEGIQDTLDGDPTTKFTNGPDLFRQINPYRNSRTPNDFVSPGALPFRFVEETGGRAAENFINWLGNRLPQSGNSNGIPMPAEFESGAQYRITIATQYAGTSRIITAPWSELLFENEDGPLGEDGTYNWVVYFPNGVSVTLKDADYGDFTVANDQRFRSYTEVEENSRYLLTYEKLEGTIDEPLPEPEPEPSGFDRHAYGNPGSLSAGYPRLDSVPSDYGSPSSAFPGLGIPDTVNQPGYEPLPEAPPTGDPGTTEPTAPEDEEERNNFGYTPIPIPGTPSSWNNRPNRSGNGGGRSTKSGSTTTGRTPTGGSPSGGPGSTPITATPTDLETATVPGAIPPSNPPSDPPKNTKEDCPCNKNVLDRFDNLESLLFGGTTAASEAVSTATILDKLNKMDDFAVRAWRATHIDKVINALNLLTALHNASMLSRDLAETLFYLISSGLDAIGIEDSEGNPLNIGGIVGGTVNGFVRGLLGDAFVDGAIETYAKANRIIQSASSIIWTVRTLTDTSLDLMEWIGENTGRIGNALKNNGVVGERSYPWMSERPRAGGRLRTRIDKSTGQIENLTDRIDTYTQATSAVVEIQEETGQLIENFGQFSESVTQALPDPWLDNEPVAESFSLQKDASASPPVDPADAQRG